RAMIGSDPRVEMCGSFEHKDLGGILREMDVLVCPSLWMENTPLVILEAMAAGMPVVATDLPGMAEVVRAGEDGLRFTAGDARALADILRRLARERPLVARLAGQTQVPLSTAAHAGKVVEVYRELVPAGRLQYGIESRLDTPVEAGLGTQFILQG